MKDIIISYDTIAAVLINYFKSENECKIILNFLDHATNIMQHVYWQQKANNDLEEARKFLPPLGY